MLNCQEIYSRHCKHLEPALTFAWLSHPHSCVFFCEKLCHLTHRYHTNHEQQPLQLQHRAIVFLFIKHGVHLLRKADSDGCIFFESINLTGVFCICSRLIWNVTNRYMQIVVCWHLKPVKENASESKSAFF